MLMNQQFWSEECSLSVVGGQPLVFLVFLEMKNDEERERESCKRPLQSERTSESTNDALCFCQVGKRRDAAPLVESHSYVGV